MLCIITYGLTCVGDSDRIKNSGMWLLCNVVVFISYNNCSYFVVEIRAWILEVACCKLTSKFTPSHLTVCTVCSKCEETPSIYWSLGKSPLFFWWCFGLSDFRIRYDLEKCQVKKAGKYGWVNEVNEVQMWPVLEKDVFEKEVAIFD